MSFRLKGGCADEKSIAKHHGSVYNGGSVYNSCSCDGFGRLGDALQDSGSSGFAQRGARRESHLGVVDASTSLQLRHLNYLSHLKSMLHESF